MKRISFLIAITLVICSCQPEKEKNNQAENITSEFNHDSKSEVVLKDYGAEPLVINIEDYTLQNETFRTSIWTGNYFQLTVMSVPVGGEVGLEIHDDIEQFLRIEEGEAEVVMGDKKDELTFIKKAGDDDVIFVPAGKWHNIINKGDKPLKLYSIYAKPEHPFGTVHKTKAESDAAEHAH